MPVTGITNLYTSYATDVIKSHVESNTINAISRASIERELISQLDRASGLNVDYKIAWYHAILHTPLFDSLWYSLSVRHALPPHTTERYVIQTSLYEPRHIHHPAQTPEQSNPLSSPSPAVKGSPPSFHQMPESEASFADASSGPSSGPSSSSSSDEDEDEVDEEAAALGRSLYEQAIATHPTTNTTTAATPGKVVGGASRLNAGVKTRAPATNSSKKVKIAGKEEEPGDGAYYASSGGVVGAMRKGIDRKAGAKTTRGGKVMNKGKGSKKSDKAKGGKVVKFAGLDGSDEGKENAEAAQRGRKRQRVPTEKAMLAMQ